MKLSELIKRSQSPDSGIRAKVAGHKDCPAELLLKFLEDPDYVVASKAMMNPNFPLPEMETLVKAFINDKNNWSSRNYTTQRKDTKTGHFSQNPALPTELISFWLDIILDIEKGSE